jgi:protein gp37
MKTEQTNIEWADYTFNPWRGCTKVSAGCANCYAETLSKRNPALLGEWGKGKPRVLASEAMWQSPLRWNADAAQTRVFNDVPMIYTGSTETVGRPETHRLTNRYHSIPAAQWDTLPVYRPRVFCASLADWLDEEVPIEWLVNLLETIHATPNLDWLLLTKRPQLWQSRLEAAHCFAWDHGVTKRHDSVMNWLGGWCHAHVPPPNVWIGTSVEDQAAADERIPALLKIPARVRFLSCEPLLGPVNLGVAFRYFGDGSGHVVQLCCERSDCECRTFPKAVHWVIAGGESGPGARPMHPAWACALRDQCAAADVPFLFKQWGEWLPGCQYGPGDTDRLQERAQHSFDLDNHSWWVGKKNAGRQLDGRTHDDFPKPL